jgi:hypothetical protein
MRDNKFLLALVGIVLSSLFLGFWIGVNWAGGSQ